jgi:hypothetical protein
MDGSAPRDVGRPSKMVPYASHVAQWLREDPTLSSAKILQRIRLAGYRGGKSALYEFVRRLRVPGSGYRRCPGCRALLRDSTGTCPHCGLSWSSPSSSPPVRPAEAPRRSREETEALARPRASAVPTGERYLVIAAPDRHELYEYFKRKFGRAAGIEVVRERRAADRRTPAPAPPLDRRRRSRRARPGLDADLRAFGFAIVIRD